MAIPAENSICNHFGKDDPDMKKLVSMTLALVLMVICLTGISFAADPIATVTTGDKTVEVTTVEDLVAAIDPSGNTVVTLKSDITYETSAIVLPYSCTIDFNGKTIRTNPTGKNGFQVKAVGTENKTTTLKNGTLVYHTVGIRVDAGAVVVSDMLMHGISGACVGLYDTAAEYKNVNLIEDSVLLSGAWGVFSFNKKDADFSQTGITIRDTKMVSYKEGGTTPLVMQGGSTVAGTVTLGTGVEIFSYKPDAFANSKIVLAGETAVAQTGLSAVAIPSLELKFPAMSKWATPATPAPVVPETPAQPETPTVPATPMPDVSVPTTGVSVVALGVMAMVSLAGAVLTKKH